MPKKRTIPKRPGGTRRIPRRKKAKPEAPQEESVKSELVENAPSEEAAPETDHARGQQTPEVVKEPEAAEPASEFDRILATFVDGKQDSDTLHENIVELCGLTSYCDAHKIVVQLRKQKLIVDNGERLDDVTPVFELAAK